MFYVLYFLLAFGSATVWTQESVDPTLILPSSTTRSLEEDDSISKRYTVKPSVPRPKSKEPKKNEPSSPVAPQYSNVLPPPPPASEDPNQVSSNTPILEPRSPELVEIRFTPNFIYTDSRSNYWFRNYYTASPGIGISSSIWLGPNFGLNCSYLASLGAEIAGAPSNSSHIPVSHQWFTFGFQWRVFNTSDLGSQLTYGFKYTDYQFLVPLDSQYRTRLKTSGLGLFLRATSPIDSHKYRFFDVEIYPQVKQREVQTSISLSSGDKVETNSITFGYGQNYKIVDKSQFFWGLRGTLEKSNYTGAANTADPITGQTPNGVTISNQIYILEFGYHWGN